MSNFVELPEPLKMLLLALVTIVVTQALKSLSDALKYDLSGYSAQVTSAIVASILVIINSGLSHIPATWEPVVTAALNLVVVLLASWGGYKFIKQFKSKQPIAVG
jgi:hypothetical protein